MVAEGIVLLGVKRLQERRGGIAPEIGAQLVDLIHHKNRIVGFALFQPLKDASGKGADIGSSMSADFSLIPDPAQ